MRVASVGLDVVRGHRSPSPRPAPGGRLVPRRGRNAEDGATKAGVCVACHGSNGNSRTRNGRASRARAPSYTAEQLRLFKAKVRVNPVMQPIVAPLTDEDINDLARVLTPRRRRRASKPIRRTGRPARSSIAAAIATRNIPACVALPRPGRSRQSGRRLSGAARPAFRVHREAAERLREGRALSRRLRAGASRPRAATRPMMATIAKRLTPEDIRNVASYIQGMR